MVTLTFPKLHKALQKDVKDLPPNDPRRGIMVVGNNAIVFAHHYCIVLDLYEYFTNDCDISDPADLDDIKSILFFMNGKTFMKEYWDELTKGANMKMDNGNLYLESPRYAKDLIFKEHEEEITMFQPLSQLEKAEKLSAKAVFTIGLPMISFWSILEILKTELKMDSIILEFNAQDQPVKFTFKNRKHLFGFIYPDYDAAQDAFRFHNLEYMVKEKNFKTIKAYFEDALPPPPPPPPGDRFQGTMKIVENDKPDLFGGEIRNSDNPNTDGEESNADGTE